MERSRRLVLASGFANEGLPAVLRNLKWVFEGTQHPDHPRANEFVWRMNSEYTFHYFECLDYPVEYCLVMGREPNHELMLISTSLEFLDVDDLLAAFDRASTQEEKEFTTFALGLGAGPMPETDISGRIIASLGSPFPRIRLAALEATVVAGWNLFRPEVQRLAANDPDASVRLMAGNSLPFLGEQAPDSTDPPTQPPTPG